MNYAEFLARKQSRVETPGRNVTAADIHPMLHDWQNELVQWAVRTSRAALWADTGMGKTVMSDLETQIAANVARKERQANTITRELVAEMKRVRETAA